MNCRRCVLSIYGKFLKFAGKGFLGCLDRLKRKREMTQSTNQTEIAMKDITRVSSKTDLDEAKFAPDYIIKTQLSRGSFSRDRSNTSG